MLSIFAEVFTHSWSMKGFLLELNRHSLLYNKPPTESYKQAVTATMHPNLCLQRHTPSYPWKQKQTALGPCKLRASRIRTNTFADYVPTKSRTLLHIFAGPCPGRVRSRAHQLHLKIEQDAVTTSVWSKNRTRSKHNNSRTEATTLQLLVFLLTCCLLLFIVVASCSIVVYYSDNLWL